jgi:ABC-type lipoprotein export system ATPase subunit
MFPHPEPCGYRHHDLTAADERELTQYRREHVGFVFQFYNLIPSLTARENVELVTDIATRRCRPPKRCGWSASASGSITFLLNCRAANSSAWR